MKRGDVVTVAAAGDYGKPRPAVVVQTDAFPESHSSVVVCQLTSDIVNAPDFRVMVEPSDKNGLRAISQIMADKPVTVRRGRIGRSIGRLDDRDLHCIGICARSGRLKTFEIPLRRCCPPLYRPPLGAGKAGVLGRARISHALCGQGDISSRRIRRAGCRVRPPGRWRRRWSAPARPAFQSVHGRRI